VSEEQHNAHCKIIHRIEWEEENGCPCYHDEAWWIVWMRPGLMWLDNSDEDGRSTLWSTAGVTDAHKFFDQVKVVCHELGGEWVQPLRDKPGGFAPRPVYRATL
jgi:hypothetical protein